MERMKKALLLPFRSMAHCTNNLRLYYWAEIKLYELRTVCVMPRWYYRWLFNTCVWLVKYRKFQRLADRAIHTIPFNIRFKVA